MKYLWAALISCAIIVSSALLANAQTGTSTVYLPLVNGSTNVAGLAESDTITVAGKVRSTGEQMTAVTLWLWSVNPNISGSRILEDFYDWQSAGSDSFAYEFTDLPRLEAGYIYYVTYINLDLTPGFLDSWATSGVGNPESGNIATLPTFNLADVTLRDPDNGETKSLPEKFAWNARDWATDQYAVQLFEENADGDVIRSVRTEYEPYPTDDVFVGRIQEGTGFLPNVPYKWRVRIRDGLGGSGIGLDTHTVILRNADEQLSVTSHADVESQELGSQLSQFHSNTTLAGGIR